MTTAGNSLGRIQIRDLSIRLGQGLSLIHI